MDITPLFSKLIKALTTKLECDSNVHTYHIIHRMIKTNSKVCIHTSELPHLPYEPNTYVIFENVFEALRILYEMYSKYAYGSDEAKQISNAHYQLNQLVHP